MDEKSALALYETNWWKYCTYTEAVGFQLFEERLVMPFDEFHKRMESVFGRPIWTHEFAFSEDLRKEFLGEKHRPSLQEILDLIPEEKRIVIQLQEESDG